MAVVNAPDNSALAQRLPDEVYALRPTVVASDIVTLGDNSFNLSGMIRARYTPPQPSKPESAALLLIYGFATHSIIGPPNQLRPHEELITGEAASALQSYLTQRSKTLSGFRDILDGWRKFIAGIIKKGK